jgi:transcriptional regulator with XRE-family HTH domain
MTRLLGMHNLSAREASELLDVSQVARSAISTGKRKPSLDTLMTLAGFFEVPRAVPARGGEDSSQIRGTVARRRSGHFDRQADRG